MHLFSFLALSLSVYLCLINCLRVSLPHCLPLSMSVCLLPSLRTCPLHNWSPTRSCSDSILPLRPQLWLYVLRSRKNLYCSLGKINLASYELNSAPICGIPNSRNQIRVTCVCFGRPPSPLPSAQQRLPPRRKRHGRDWTLDWSISPVCPIKFLPISSVIGSKKKEGKRDTVIGWDEEKREGRCNRIDWRTM